MRVSLAWLREFVDIGPDTAAALTLAGLPLAARIGAGAEEIWELEPTTNRPDWLSHFGVAREIAAIAGADLVPLVSTQTAFDETGAPAAATLRVVNEASAACGLYLARVFTAAPAGASPRPIAARLELLGHRAINNFADLTNYTLWEMGHPTHAFDADCLVGGEIRVRWARTGESLLTLDGIERRLCPEDLVIADARRPVALAGVMGGSESAISAATRRVVIESAWFDPATVRRMAKRHGLHTDASHRFERGADPAAPPVALDRIAARAHALGALIAPGVIAAAGALPQPASIRLRPEAVTRILGEAVAESRTADILARLGFAHRDGAWLAPTWRPDVTREIDLIEEIARLEQVRGGPERFAPRRPAFTGVAAPLPHAALRDRTRHQLRALGFAEAVALSFADAAACRRFAPALAPVHLMNPLSDEAAVMRTTGIPALLDLLRYNLHRSVARPRLYEIGKRYFLDPSGPAETWVLTLGGSGGIDFAALKGAVAAVLDGFATGRVDYVPLTEAMGLARGRSAEARLEAGRGSLEMPPAERASAAGNRSHDSKRPPGATRVRSGGSTTRVAVLGALDAAAAEVWKLPHDATWVAEIELEHLFALGARPVHYQPPSRFPASERDFSFLFDQSRHWADIERALRLPAIPDLTEIVPLEVFRDSARLGENLYSLLLRARFQRWDRTLREEEVQAAAAEIVARLRHLGGTQR